MKRNFEVFCGVPDRVIDAPIPEDLKEMYYNVSHARSGYSPLTWNDEVKPLIERIARLEAEKQDARRVGLEFALHLANETADWCIEEQEKGYLGAMRVADAIKKELSRPLRNWSGYGYVLLSEDRQTFYDTFYREGKDLNPPAPLSTGETESPILDVNHE